tara:strand:+ start:1285 stop:1953 length:669 start_codon:yes stop_codon:yes gene_type:complete
MLNTKDMSAGSGKTRPVITVGNQKVKINKITFDQTPYDKDAYNVVLHVESEPVTGEFDGFLVDSMDQNGPRYKGQVGRVRLSPFAYKDATLPSGREITRDQEVLKSMIFLSETLGKRNELDNIEANTIEEFMVSANEMLSGDTYINACIGGREWENKEGYINFDLFLPRNSKDGVALESLDNDNSRLYTFSKSEHVRELKNKTVTAGTFEPEISSKGDDFDL